MPAGKSISGGLREAPELPPERPFQVRFGARDGPTDGSSGRLRLRNLLEMKVLEGGSEASSQPPRRGS